MDPRSRPQEPTARDASRVDHARVSRARDHQAAALGPGAGALSPSAGTRTRSSAGHRQSCPSCLRLPPLRDMRREHDRRRPEDESGGVLRTIRVHRAFLARPRDLRQQLVDLLEEHTSRAFVDARREKLDEPHLVEPFVTQFQKRANTRRAASGTLGADDGVRRLRDCERRIAEPDRNPREGGLVRRARDEASRRRSSARTFQGGAKEQRTNSTRDSARALPLDRSSPAT